MPIQAVNPPKSTRKSKYAYTPEDATQAVELLEKGESPGDGPFDTAGKARSAANSLIEVIGRNGTDNSEVGSRVWEDEAGFMFSLKIGRREYRGRKSSGGKKK